MSWWDPKAFSLSKAIKTAQEQIDKVLDIQGEEGGKGKGAAEKAAKPEAAPSTSSPEGAASQDETESNSWNSWSSWMTPKTPGDSDAKEADTSWGVVSGTKNDSSSKTDAARLTSASKGRTAKPSASRKLDLHAGDSKQKTTSVSEEEDSRAVKTESSPEGEKSIEKEESVGGSRLSPEITADEGGTGTVTSVGDVMKRKTVPAEPESGEPSPAEQEQLFDHVPAADTNVEISEREDPWLTAGKEDVTSRLTEAESGQTAGDNAEGLGGGGAESADSSIPEVLVEEDGEKADSGESAEPVLRASADHFGTAREPIPTDPGASQGWDSQSNAPVVADSNVSQTSTSLEEAFETVTKDSSSRETMESYETATSASSSETLISREASFTQISVSEDVQAASVSSVSSEPVLLSMSTDDNNVTQEEEVTWPDAGLFNPLGHSPAVSESEMVRTSSPVDVLSLQEEQASPVCSPPLDSTATVSSNDSSETSRLDSSADTVIDRSQQLFEETAGDEAGSEEADESQHWMGESSLIDLAAASSPSASFVKCMIEDAMGMEDASKHEDSGSDNHSEEKSDGSKGDSEFEKSIYSGHESNDEIETTTSSDIEIISTPTPNGGENMVDLSPLQFTLQSRAARHKAQCHHRSDSQSSSSTHSKGDIDHLSPEREDWHGEGKGSLQQDTAAQDDDLDNPQHPQRLLKKLAEMAEVLQARENKLVQLSKDNNDFLEANSILRSQLHQAEEEQNAKMTDLTALTDEFTRRMGESERKNQAILKEKETLKQQLQSAQSQLAKKAEDTNLEAMLIEKDEQITGLMEEGEKLSKQQLQNSNIIKKLRSKEKENEGLIASQKKKVEQQKEELDRLKIVLDSKEDMEKKQADVIKQLNAAVQAMEKEKAKLTVEVESADEKIRGLQATLDNSYKEIAELHKSNATQDSRAQQAALSAEMQVREELKMNIEQQRQQHQREREALIMQIEDLRMSLARMEKEHSRREEMLKQENSDLQMRLQEDESRSQDLTQSVTSATRPLLRQIENLQATHSIQASAWEKVERNLAERLSDAQTLLALAQEKERSATEKLAEVSSRCAALEASNSQLRKEKAQLTAQQENDRRRIDMLEERRASDIAQLELAKQKLSEEVASIRKDKVFLEQQLETERNRLEAEKQRVSVAEEQIRIMERERPRSRGTPSPVSVSRQESVNSSFSERSSTPTWLQRQDDGEGFMMAATPSGPKTSLYDSMRNSGASALMENLHSQLKLREGEISQLQAEIQQLERTRESMARELVNLTNQNEELQDEVKELPKLRTEYQGLNGRYNALLQMYGEKEEQVQELRLDLDDVKEMYKQQINSLMQ